MLGTSCDSILTGEPLLKEKWCFQVLIYNLPETVKEADIEKLSFAAEIAEEFSGRVNVSADWPTLASINLILLPHASCQLQQVPSRSPNSKTISSIGYIY